MTLPQGPNFVQFTQRRGLDVFVRTQEPATAIVQLIDRFTREVKYEERASTVGECFRRLRYRLGERR